MHRVVLNLLHLLLFIDYGNALLLRLGKMDLRGIWYGFIYRYGAREVVTIIFHIKSISFISFLATTFIGIIYTLVVIISSQKYRVLARRLTNFENHRTDSLFQKHLLLKLLVFEFINNFLVLYLLAFIYEDIAMLRATVVTTMTISQVFVEIFEGIVPFFLYKQRTKGWIRIDSFMAIRLSFGFLGYLYAFYL